MIELKDFNLDETLASINPYEAETINRLIKKYGDEERAAEAWINYSGPREVKHFGGDEGTQLVVQRTSYWKRFKEQIDGFICGSVEWEKRTH